MDGLECSEILFSEIDLGDRIDAEYFSKEYLQIGSLIGNVKTLKIGQIATTVASAFYPAATQLYSIGDTAFVRCVDCINYPIISKDQDIRFEKIPYSFAENSKGISLLRGNEIVITKVGTPCYASIVTDYDEVALSRTVMGLSNIRGVDPYFLMVFLRCKYGFEQLYRQRELTIQYQLTLSRVNAIDVYIPSVSFQDTVKDIVLNYHIVLHESDSLYQAAQKDLLTNLCYTSETVSTENVSEKQLSESFLKSGRLDAEYYQPKYDNLFTVLSKQVRKSLGQLVTIMKSIEPGSEYYGDIGIPFIRVSDVSKIGIASPSIKIPKNTIPFIETLFLKKDTILFSKDGSVGIAYKIKEDMTAVTSSALLHLRVKNSSEILPDYLTLVLNSEIVQLQAERDASGAIIQHWKPSDIEKVVIPILPYDFQLGIAKKIQRSFSLRKKADNLIQIAVKAVELAIEQSEETATKWLKENVESLEG